MMYHALAKAGSGDNELKEKVSTVDKFISIAPCLYIGSEFESDKEQKDARAQLKKELKALDSLGIDYVFGADFDADEFLSEFCDEIDYDAEEDEPNVYCQLAESGYSEYYGTVSI